MSDEENQQEVTLPWDGRPQVVVFLNESGEVMVGGYNMNEEGFMDLPMEEMLSMLDVAKAKLNLAIVRAAIEIRRQEERRGAIYVPE